MTLCENEVFESTAVTGDANNAWNDYVLTGPEFEDKGPAIVDIMVDGEGVNFTNKHTYRVILQFKGDNGDWGPDDANAVVLLARQTSGAYVLSGVFNDRSKLGKHIRVVLQTQVDTNGSGTHKGTHTIRLMVRYYCGC